MTGGASRGRSPSAGVTPPEPRSVAEPPRVAGARRARVPSSSCTPTSRSPAALWGRRDRHDHLGGLAVAITRSSSGNPPSTLAPPIRRPRSAGLSSTNPTTRMPGVSRASRTRLRPNFPAPTIRTRDCRPAAPPSSRSTQARKARRAPPTSASRRSRRPRTPRREADEPRRNTMIAHDRTADMPTRQRDDELVDALLRSATLAGRSERDEGDVAHAEHDRQAARKTARSTSVPTPPTTMRYATRKDAQIRTKSTRISTSRRGSSTAWRRDGRSPGRGGCSLQLGQEAPELDQEHEGEQHADRRDPRRRRGCCRRGSSRRARRRRGEQADGLPLRQTEVDEAVRACGPCRPG